MISPCRAKEWATSATWRRSLVTFRFTSSEGSQLSRESVRRQPTMYRALIVLVLSIFGCVSDFNVRYREPLPVPNLLDLSPTEALGYEIYLRDQAAWEATDVALAAGLKETPAHGWITLLSIGGWTVRFVGSCDAGACAYLDVEKTDPSARPIVTLQNGTPLPEDQAARWRARQLAGSIKFRACTPTYNTVVTSAEVDGAPVWRVYLLASSTDPRDVVLAGHHRMTISYDGKSVLSQEALSKSCITSQPPSNVAGMFVTDILHSEPIETHVFTSLDYRMPLFVGTSEGSYKVNGANIRRMED